MQTPTSASRRGVSGGEGSWGGFRPLSTQISALLLFFGWVEKNSILILRFAVACLFFFAKTKSIKLVKVALAWNDTG